MREVLLKRNGDVILIEKHFDSKEGEIVIEKIISPEELMLTFKIPLLLEEQVTLRSVFKAVRKYPSLQYIQPFLFEYLDKIEYLPKINCREDYRAILVTGHNELHEHDYHINLDFFNNFNNCRYVDLEDNEGPYIRDFSYYYSASLLSEDLEDNLTYAMDFEPIEKILDVPIEIGDMNYIHQRMKKKNNLESNIVLDILIKGELSITLFEFIDAILEEITFHGFDDSKRKRYKELEESSIEMDKYINAMDDENHKYY